jgi:hypothetical protein
VELKTFREARGLGFSLHVLFHGSWFEFLLGGAGFFFFFFFFFFYFIVLEIENFKLVLQDIASIKKQKKTKQN